MSLQKEHIFHSLPTFLQSIIKKGINEEKKNIINISTQRTTTLTKNQLSLSNKNLCFVLRLNFSPARYFHSPTTSGTMIYTFFLLLFGSPLSFAKERQGGQTVHNNGLVRNFPRFGAIVSDRLNLLSFIMTVL